MNLFNDPNLLNQFHQIVHPIKVAQEAAPVDPNAIKTLATKLVDNLDKDTSLTVGKADAALYMKDLQDLNSFISFLKLENVQYGGKRLVVDNYDTLSPEDKPSYLPYKWLGGLDAFPINSTIGIYGDGLIAYLKSLQQNASATGGAQGKLLNALLGKLIDSANSTLKTSISHEDLKASVESKEAPTKISDNTPLDRIGSMTVDNPLVPTWDQGSVIVTPKDLKSKSDFDALLHKLTLKKGDKILIYSEFTNENYCDLIRILHTRAETNVFRRGSTIDKAYLQLMTDLASQYNCDVNAKEPSGVKPVSYHEEGGSGAKLSGGAQKAAASLAMKMPLLTDRIDFPRISNWLAGYAQIGPQVKMDPATSVAIGHAQQILETIANTYRVPSQSLAQEANAVASTVITNTLGSVAQKAAAPAGYLHQLQQLMSLLGTILSAFKNNTYDSLPQDAKDDIDEQIGSSGSSLYNINIDRINRWLLDLPSALQSIRQQGF